MKKQLHFFVGVLMVFSLLLPKTSLAQEICGFDHLLDQVLSDSTAHSNFDSVRLAIRIQIQNNASSRSMIQPNNYVVPVVFHIIGNGTAAAITDAQVNAQLQLLNDGFANLLGSSYSVADDAQITFCLAQTTPTGAAWSTFGSTTNGITRTTTPTAITVSNNHNSLATGANSQQALANVIYFNPQRYLNIWIVNSISLAAPPSYFNNVLGYSPYPLITGPPGQYLDGIVMRSDAFGIGSANIHYNQGRTLVHEAGHYLGLFHTFAFACNEVAMSNPCNADGDECCDTPPVAAPNQTDCLLLSGTNSCHESPDLNDMYENHMDYAYDNINTCRNTFTDDQSNRMHATIQLYRSVLVSYSNLLQTGVLCLPPGLNPTFATTEPNGSTQFCSGVGYGFTSSPGATSYSWTFTGGTPGSSASANPTGIVWGTPGVYNVSLTVTDPSGSLSSTIQVFVSNCIPYSGNKANWYFGDNAAISFSSGSATAISPSSINTVEASSTRNNSSGNLLFYTNGRSVWDATHSFMVNGNNTLNGSPNSTCPSANAISSAKGVVSIPRPGIPNRYFIYTLSDAPVITCSSFLGYGVSQYEVDLTTPPGTVVSTTPVNPAQNYATNESILAIPHCNGTDYWIIVKPVNNTQTGLVNPGPLSGINTRIASYLVNSSGIANIPVLSSSGPFVPPSTWPGGGGNAWIVQSSVSPDKKYIAFADCGSTKCYIFTFDCASGILNYLTTLNNSLGYGVSFSPDSKKLYMMTSGSHQIRQHDLTNLNSCNPNPPFVDFDFVPTGTPFTMSPFPFATLQLGPDNKIYIARPSYFLSPANIQRNLAVINFPNNIITSSTSNECGYNYNGIYLLGTQVCRGDLPNDMDAITAPPSDNFSFCISNCANACFTNLGCGTTFTWNFGDGNFITGINSSIPPGTNGGTTTGNFEYPCHTYAGPGTYNVTLSIDGHPLVTHTLIIATPPIPTILGPNPVCSTSTLPESYFGPSGYLYSWTATNGTPTAGNLQTFNVTWTAFPAALALTVTDPANGCTNTQTITITQTSLPPTVNAGPDATVCISGSTLLNGTITNGTITGWSPPSSLSCTTCLNPTASPVTTTTYTLSASNGCGSANDQVTITAVNCGCTMCPNILPSSGTTFNQVYCINTPVTIATSTTLNIVLSEVRIYTGMTITVNPGATLNITGSHLYACSDMWQGIVVKPGGIVNVIPFTLLSIPIRSSLIEDAITAIDVQSSPSITINPLTVTSATFNKNKVAIKISNHSNLTGPLLYPISFTNSVITCRNLAFTAGSLAWPQTNAVKGLAAVTNPLQTPYINNTTYPDNTPIASYLKAPFLGQKPGSGIVLSNVGGIIPPLTPTPTYVEMQIGTSGLLTYNVFDNLGICIDASNTNLTCVNNVFQKTDVPQGDGIAINAVVKDIVNCRLRVIPASGVQFSNRFYDCGKSINSVNYYENTATYCDVRSTQNNGITAPAASPANFRGKFGIFVVTNRFRTILLSNNDMYNIENGIVFNATSGTYSVGGGVITGQYSGQVDINNNTMRPFVPFFPYAGSYVANAITVTNAVSSGITVVAGNTVKINNNNPLSNVYRGILTSNWTKKDLFCNSNAITMLADPFTSPPATINPNQFGIAFSKNTSATIPIGSNIVDNNITGPGITVNPNFYGVAVNLSLGTLVKCNKTNSITKGIAFAGNCVPTSFNHNDMTAHQYGFVLDNAGQIGPQGNSTSPTDNRWMGTWTGGNFKTGVLATTTASTAVGSQIYVRNTTGIFNPNGSGFSATGAAAVYSNANGTVLYITNNPLYVPCPLSSLPALAAIISSMEQVAQNLTPLGNNIAETRYINKNQLFRTLKEEPSYLTSSTILQNFYSASLGTARETFANIEDDISMGDLANSQIKTAGILPQNTIEENYKAFYETYLKQQTDTISDTDSIDLVSIAKGCPFIGGPVVYQARALYNSIFMTNIMFEDNCDVVGRSSQTDEVDKTTEELYKVHIYPNPTPGEFTVELNGSDEIQISIEIKDLQGRIVYSEISNNHVVKLKPDAKNGVYLVHITNVLNNETVVKKLVIQK